MIIDGPITATPVCTAVRRYVELEVVVLPCGSTAAELKALRRYPPRSTTKFDSDDGRSIADTAEIASSNRERDWNDVSTTSRCMGGHPCAFASLDPLSR